MNNAFYEQKLYPLQDQVLMVCASVETNFYLTGGTALSRGYLHHRYSDDLDFFVNDDASFHLMADRIIYALSNRTVWRLNILQREERYLRLYLQQGDADLKIEMINDVPSRVGNPWLHPTLGRIDTAENILANKVTAILDREAPKDFADVWGLCYQMNLSLREAITGAQGKAAGIFPVDLARVLCSVTRDDWELVRWISAPNPNEYVEQINLLGRNLITSV